MRRLTLILAIAALAAALPSVAAPQVRHPSLTLQSRNPLVVRGTEFRPREAVHVVFYAGDRTKVVFVRATRSGAFLASADVPVTRCAGVRIVANGLRGSRAIARLPLPACMPVVQPGRVGTANP